MSDPLDIFYSSADAIAYLDGYVGSNSGKATRAVEYLKAHCQPVTAAQRPARCESCGYVESHDPNCPRDRTPWREWAERHDLQGDDTELKAMFDAERAGALARSESATKDSERVKELEALINSPEVNDFLEGVRREAAHQVERWGTAHDRAKRPADWFWLVGYLAGKALHAALAGDKDKARHHCISTAAALFNWHNAISGHDQRMAPGSSDVAKIVEGAFPGETVTTGAERPRE